MFSRRRVSLAGPAPAPAPEAGIVVEARWDEINSSIRDYLEHVSSPIFEQVGPEPVGSLKEALRLLCSKCVFAERVVVGEPVFELISYTESRRSVLRFPDLGAGTVRLRVLPHPQFACEVLLKFKPPSALLREIDLMQSSLGGYIPPYTPTVLEYKKPDHDRAERQATAVLEATKEHLWRAPGEVALLALNGLLASSKRGLQPISLKVLSALLERVLPQKFATAQAAGDELEQLVTAHLLYARVQNAKTRSSQLESTYVLVTLSHKGAAHLKEMGVQPAFVGVFVQK